MNIRQFNINSKKDVKEFYEYLFKELKICFNPDDDFEE